MYRFVNEFEQNKNLSGLANLPYLPDDGKDVGENYLIFYNLSYLNG